VAELDLMRTLSHSLLLATLVALLAASPALALAGGTSAPSSPAAGVKSPVGTTGGVTPTTPRADTPAPATTKPRKHRRKRRRHPAQPSAPAPHPAADTATREHRFPLVGAFSYPSGGQFGAARSGHVHQGQDLSAALGTPVVAPHAGTVTTVAYQAGGAGYYVVLSGSGESLDYVFMHIQAGSVRVRVGQVVQAGARIGSVGNTGESSGPHLHFEIWLGPWRSGGKPVNPRPYLDAWRSGRATTG
jgi:murein DD-endopeptidase MepM/ murein hydrolase activator NlpD